MMHHVPLCNKDRTVCPSLFSKNMHFPKPKPSPTRQRSLCAPAKLQHTQLADCWPDPKQHGGLFPPADKRGLASHIEYGDDLLPVASKEERREPKRERRADSRNISGEAKSGHEREQKITDSQHIKQAGSMSGKKEPQISTVHRPLQNK